MEFRILGPVEVVRDGQRLTLGGPKPRALLAILLLHRNRVVAADRLVELLWGDESPDTATHSLQVHISQLRKVLSSQVLESRPPGYLLNVGDEQLDASRFEAAINVAVQKRQAGELEQASASLREALALWRGEPLADVATSGFAIAEVARLNELRLRALEERIDIGLGVGGGAQLVPELEALLAQHPLRERLCAQLMLALYRAGRQADASDVYYRTRERLVDELGMEPGMPLQTVLKQILRQDASLDEMVPLEAHAVALPVRRALCPVLVGRRDDLRTLETALHRSTADGNQLLLLAGGAGIGKTRLAEELLRCAQGAGLHAMWGGCSEAELALPYLPVVEAIGNYVARIDLGTLRRRIGPLARELGHLLPQFQEDAPPYDPGDPGQARVRLFEAILALLKIAAQPGGLLLVIEDIHWADASTRELLDYLVRRLRSTKVTLLLTYRHDEVGADHPLMPHLRAWQRAAEATLVALRPLTAKEVSAMAGAIFEQEGVSNEFGDVLYSRTEGNPFVLEELLKSAIDRGDIFRTDQGWQRKTVGELTIPRTLREAIVQRLSRLNAEHAAVVRTAALLGQSFSYAALMAAAGLPEGVIRAALHESMQHQLIEAGSDEHLRFRHALTQEAIYDDLLPAERIREHGRVADALQKMAGIPSAEIAEHLVRAHRWDEAVPALIRAAEEAETRRGYREAVDLYKRALTHVSEPVVRARLGCRQAEAFYLVGEPTQAEPLLRASVPVLERAGQTAEAARHRLTLGSCYWLAGRNDQARQQYEMVRTSLEAGPASDPLAHAYNRLALLDLNDMEMEKAIAMADAAIAMGEAAGADVPRIWGYNFRGCGLGGLGAVEAGFADLERSWREASETALYEVAGDALSNEIDLKVWCLMASETPPLLERMAAIPDAVHSGGRLATWLYERRAMVWVVLGDVFPARTAAIEGLRLAQEAESGLMLIPVLRSWLALAESALGQPDEARRLVQGIQQEMATMVLVEADLGTMTVYIDLGELELARLIATRALEYAERSRHLLVQDVWLVDKAVEVFIAVQLPDEAERLRLKAKSAPQVMRPLIDRIEGRMAFLRGDLTRADDLLSAATRFFRDRSYRAEEWRTRRALADVKARQGDRGAAARELRLVVADAEVHGNVFEATAARRQLDGLAAEAPRAR